jgi:hypothetical protein
VEDLNYPGKPLGEIVQVLIVIKDNKDSGRVEEKKEGEIKRTTKEAKGHQVSSENNYAQQPF